MKKLLVILVLGLGLNGCASMVDPDKYSDWPEHSLCIGYYVDVVTANIHASAKRDKIAERQIDCEPYKEEGIMKGEAINQHYENLKKHLE